jgi:hypothetical protein
VLEILFDGGNQRFQRKPEIPEKTRDSRENHCYNCREFFIGFKIKMCTIKLYLNSLS